MTRWTSRRSSRASCWATRQQGIKHGKFDGDRLGLFRDGQSHTNRRRAQSEGARAGAQSEAGAIKTESMRSSDRMSDRKATAFIPEDFADILSVRGTGVGVHPTTTPSPGTAFLTPSGRFEFTTAPFGFTPSAVQGTGAERAKMEEALRKETEEKLKVAPSEDSGAKSLLSMSGMVSRLKGG